MSRIQLGIKSIKAKLQGLLFKKLNVFSDGNVLKGGFLTYTAAPESGDITAQGNVTLRYLWSDHDFPFSAVYKVDPKLLRSENVKPGLSLKLGNVTIVVMSVVGKSAVAHVTVEGTIPAQGDVTISLASEYIELMSVDAKASAFGLSAQLKAA